MRRRKNRSPKTESALNPKYAKLHDRIKSCIRARIEKRLSPVRKSLRLEDFDDYLDALLFRIILLADKQFFKRSSRIICDLNPESRFARWAVADSIQSRNRIKEHFSREISVLRKLYKLMDQNTDCSEIVAKMEPMLSAIK